MEVVVPPSLYTNYPDRMVPGGAGSELRNDISRGAMEGTVEDVFAFQNILPPPALAIDLDLQDFDDAGVGRRLHRMVGFDQLVDEFDLPLFSQVAPVEVDFGLHVPELDQARR